MDQKNQRCVPYPRKNMAVHKHTKIDAPAPEWVQPNDPDGFQSRPVYDSMLPQVQWRDAKDYLKDCKDDCKLPLCVWLGK